MGVATRGERRTDRCGDRALVSRGGHLMAAPLRTERRPVRPFRGLAPFQRALSTIAFVADGQVVEESVTFTPNELLSASFSVRADLDAAEIETGLESTGLAPESISLLIFARSRTLKQTDVIRTESLSASLERNGLEINVDRASNPLLF